MVFVERDRISATEWKNAADSRGGASRARTDWGDGSMGFSSRQSLISRQSIEIQKAERCGGGRPSPLAGRSTSIRPWPAVSDAPIAPRAKAPESLAAARIPSIFVSLDYFSLETMLCGGQSTALLSVRKMLLVMRIDQLSQRIVALVESPDLRARFPFKGVVAGAPKFFETARNGCEF